MAEIKDIDTGLLTGLVQQALDCATAEIQGGNVRQSTISILKNPM